MVIVMYLHVLPSYGKILHIKLVDNYHKGKLIGAKHCYSGQNKRFSMKHCSTGSMGMFMIHNVLDFFMLFSLCNQILTHF